jgi:chemotaxis protein histidine kinase CheA
MILLALSASSFADDLPDDKKPAAVPAIQQEDSAAKAEAEAKAAAEKAEAEAKAAAEKAEAEAKAAAEKAEAKAAAEKTEAQKAVVTDKVYSQGATTGAAEKKAKKDAEAKAAAEKAAVEAKAAEEKAKKEAEAEAKANSFEVRFPELAKAIAEADLTEDKRAEIDAMSANLIASSDALAVVASGDQFGDEYTTDELDCLIEFLTQYTAILAEVPTPETEELLADNRLRLLNAREQRLELAQQDYEAGRITAEEFDEIKDKYVAADDEADVIKPAKKEPFWGYRKHKPIPYLVIVANYRIPRKVIAEYLRSDFDVPYILLPSDSGKPSKDDQLYFSGGKKSSDELEVAFPAVQLSRFIAYLRPETVIILGDDSYINPVYRLAVPENIRKVEFDDSEWKLNAVRLDEFFRRTKKTDVSEHYLEFLQEQDKPGKE